MLHRRVGYLFVSFLAVVMVAALVTAIWGSGEPTRPGALPSAGNDPMRVPVPGTTADPAPVPGTTTTVPATTPVPTTTAGPGRTAGPGETAAPGTTVTRTSALPPGPRVILWIEELGLSSGADDIELIVFNHLADGECDQVIEDTQNSEGIPAYDLEEPGLSLYKGAAHACLAAFYGRPDLWASAQDALRVVGSQSSQMHCLEKGAYRLLQALVEVHRQHPDARFATTFGSGQSMKCPRVKKVIPDHGPRAGGYPVRLIGENLFRGTVIRFGELDVPVASGDGRTATITVPPAHEALRQGAPDGQVFVAAKDSPFGPPQSAFDYDPPRTGGVLSSTSAPPGG